MFFKAERKNVCKREREKEKERDCVCRKRVRDREFVRKREIL